MAAMANTTQPWLDDLSEEWIPLPPPDAPADNSDDSVAGQTAQTVQPKSRSRLPRMRQSSGSLSEIQVRSIANELRPPKQRNALAEPSLSENNIPPTASRHASCLEQSASYSFSSELEGSAMYNGTIAQDTVARSPTKDKETQDTPEWRRRLVEGDLGYGDQKDLFGPSGLENIFQKPAGSPVEETQQPKSRVGVLKGLWGMRSSPPPWATGAQDRTFEHQEETHQIAEEGDTHQDSHAAKQNGSARSQTKSHFLQAQLSSSQLAPRTASGQIEFENESFSPVYLTTNLKVGQPPGEIPNFRGSELANRLRQIGSPPQTTYPHISEDNSMSDAREDSSLSRLRDDSLPEGLPAGTPDLAKVGCFVEVRRGGYSRDGSFRRRPLSPSPERPTGSSGLRREVGRAESDSNFLQPPSADSKANPKTPHRQENKQYLSPEHAKGSGSPLKLFDAHDTFTSNRLQRRLSQLEYKSDNTSSSNKEARQQVRTATPKVVRLTSVEESSFQSVVDDPFTDVSHSTRQRVGTFGEGELSKYQFSGEFSVASNDDSVASEDFASEGSPGMDIAPPGSRQPFKFVLDDSCVSPDGSVVRRKVSSPMGNLSISRNRPKFQNHRKASGVSTQGDSELLQAYGEGKRGPASPYKNPTPKRRRTLHSMDAEEQEEREGSSSDIVQGTDNRSRSGVGSIAGRKRKDARHDSSANIADAETLAKRHILRPRNPTPSQRRRDEIHAEVMEATEAFMLSSPKLNTIREQLDSSVLSDDRSEQAKATEVANEVAAFSMREQHVTRDDSRKRSVTTQDFLDEALKIMDFIRTKGRPTSGLGSLEETEAESELVENSAEQLPSSLTFERPPSREGRLSAWTEPNKNQLDSKVVSHLQKYQEKEQETFLNSSVNSIRLSRMRGVTTPDGESMVIEQNDIRITDNPNRHLHTDDVENDPVNSQPRTNNTQQSTGSSVAHTVATNASRWSDHVATLAPEAVAHLIPQEVAGMSFDREKNIWVRQKSPSKEIHREKEQDSCLNESEEDPFDSIPDLTVDETKEQDIKVGSPVRPQPPSKAVVEEVEKTSPEEPERPVTREGQGIALTDVSSAPSKVSNFGWSYPKTETRATSWSTQAPQNWSTQKRPQAHTTYAIPESDEDDIEHEIQYFEGRDQVQPNAQRTQVRDITISFADQGLQGLERQPAGYSQSSDQYQETSRARPMHERRQPGQRQMASANTLPHTRSKRMPMFTGDGDLSLLEEMPSKNYRMQFSMSVSAPVLGHAEDALATAPSSPAKADVTFMLSDLPEFTLHQVDECELPTRVLVKQNGAQFSKALEDRYAQGTADLVKALQDVEPDEPYWEDLRHVDLSKKHLTTMHRLDELCYRLEELDISGNMINQVKGIPYSMRRLQASSNCLTGLTSWTTLVNLQHLDVSSNEIDCLDGLAELVHLRVLKVNNNNIKSLDGIIHLDGLMELHAGGNNIEMVDFARSNLASLTDLDLRENQLLEVRNLHSLPRLQQLNLDDNQIDEFPLFDIPVKPLKTLRSIRICRNGASLINVERHFPELESLYVDGNSLTQVDGLETLRYLRTFSARDQILDVDPNTNTCVNNLIRNTEVRNLYVSLNPSYSIGISQHLLSLQRLELASMGLKELPHDFGQLTPNIRSVNLNFNSLKDLRPLLNIKRLNELLLVGNKLERLRANAMVLGKLETITKLDWRDNPLTLRFYAPTSENRIMSLRQKPSDEQLTDRFILPEGDLETDILHLERLDYETRIRRRVTEMMLANLCKNLKELDGLPFDKARILVKDDVWERLLFLGVIQKKRPDEATGSPEQSSVRC